MTNETLSVTTLTIPATLVAPAFALPTGGILGHPHCEPGAITVALTATLVTNVPISLFVSRVAPSKLYEEGYEKKTLPAD